jgi:hypothetical protein
MLRIILPLLFAAAHANFVNFDNPEPIQSYVPCVHFSRSCYPGLEVCHNYKACILKQWISFTSLFTASLIFLLIASIMYLVSEYRTKLFLGLVITFGILSLGNLGTLIVFATYG